MITMQYSVQIVADWKDGEYVQVGQFDSLATARTWANYHQSRGNDPRIIDRNTGRIIS